MGKRSRMNDAGNSGELPDDDRDVELVEEQADDQGPANGNGQVHTNVANTNKNFAGCIPASADEIEDLIIELRQVSGSRVRADRVRSGGEYEYLSHTTAVDFDFDWLIEQWGAGRYRIMGRVDGEKHVRWKRIVTVAAKPGTQARAVEGNQVPSDPRLAPPPPAYPWPMPPQYLAQYPPPPVQAPPADGGAMGAMFQLMIGQAKQQSDLLLALLAQKVEQNAPQHKTITEQVGDLLKVMKDLKTFNRGGGASDPQDESFWGPALSSFGTAIVRALEERSQAPSSATTVPAPAAGLNRAPASPLAPTPRPATAPAVAENPHPAKRAAETRATPARLTDEQRINNVGRLLVLSSDAPDRDAESYALIISDMLGDALAERLLSLPAGQLGPMLIEQIPQLTPSAAFLADVEVELRGLFSEEPGSTDAPEHSPEVSNAGNDDQ